MSTIAMKPRPLLGSLATARVEHYPVQRIAVSGSESTKNVPAEVPPVASGQAAAWDPHEVWLSRVKKPREQRSA